MKKILLITIMVIVSLNVGAQTKMYGYEITKTLAEIKSGNKVYVKEVSIYEPEYGNYSGRGHSSMTFYEKSGLEKYETGQWEEKNNTEVRSGNTDEKEATLQRNWHSMRESLLLRTSQEEIKQVVRSILTNKSMEQMDDLKFNVNLYYTPDTGEFIKCENIYRTDLAQEFIKISDEQLIKLYEKMIITLNPKFETNPAVKSCFITGISFYFRNVLNNEPLVTSDYYKFERE